MTVPRSRRFPGTMADGILAANVVGEPIVSLDAGEAEVVDTRGCIKLTPWFGAGTHSYQPCDEDGTVITGSSSSEFMNGIDTDVIAPFYKVTADAGNALTLARV